MKGIKATILFCIVLLAFFSTSIFFQSHESVTTFLQLTSSVYKISNQLLEAYDSGEADEKTEAKAKLLQITLKNLQYSQWLDYQEYIDLNIYRGRVLPGTGSQLLISLNLSKDQAVVAVYDYINGDYVYSTAIQELAPIKDLLLLPYGDAGYDFIVIPQILDERLGAYMYEEFMDIYLYSTDGLKKVWNKTLYYQETYKEIWINPNANDTIWNRVEEETLVDFIKGNPLRINTVTTQKKLIAQLKTMPEDTQFTVSKTNTSKSAYYWNDQYHTFIMAELSKAVFLTKAALLEDMAISREALYGIENNSYRIITHKGEIIYLPKSSFKGLIENLLEE